MGFSLGILTMIGVVAGTGGRSGELVVISACLILAAAIVPRPQSKIAIAGLVGLLTGYGVSSYVDDTQQSAVPEVLPTSVEGVLTSDPRLSAAGHSVELDWDSSGSGSSSVILIYRGIEDIGRGDRIEVEGKWGGSDATVFFADRLEVVAQAGAVEKARRRLRAVAGERVLDRVPGSNGSLALGLIIGDDSGLTRAERDDLRASGLTHITAVSGSNVAIVIVVIAFVMRALNRRGWVWFSLLLGGITFYVWIVGPTHR